MAEPPQGHRCPTGLHDVPTAACCRHGCRCVGCRSARARQQSSRSHGNEPTYPRVVGLGVQLGDWAEQARCLRADPDVFYAEKGDTLRPALRVCNGVEGESEPCPVRVECLDWALTFPERWGVWGGLSPQKRRKLERAGTRAEDVELPGPERPESCLEPDCDHAGVHQGRCEPHHRQAREAERGAA